MSPLVNAIPWGLGWAHRLGGPNLTRELSPADAYAAVLFFGVMALSVPALLVGAVATWLLGQNVASAVVMTGAVVVNLVCMVAVATYPRAFRPIVWVALGVHAVQVLLNTYFAGGIVASGFQPLWLLITPLVGTLILGSRDGLWLTLVAVAMLWTIPLLPGDVASVERRGMPVEGILGSMAAFALCLFMVLNWFIGQRRIVEQQLDLERARVEELLHNVLPSEIAVRLKSGDVEARFHEEVSVLFADLVGFTALSQDMSASRLVKMLDGLFGQFDLLAEQHGLCKIKTIGDCYMVASGVPSSVEDHDARLARFALDMRDAVADRDDLSLRIGMDSGPVVAGIIGKKRFLFDLWGDTVNTASRMESHGEAGRIQLTQRMRRQLGGRFVFEERGEIEIKGKGVMTTCFLEGEAGAQPS